MLGSSAAHGVKSCAKHFSFLIAALMLVEAAFVGGAEAKPNIIVILADDVGYSDLGCFGSEINTPNLISWLLMDCGLRNFIIPALLSYARALLTGVYSHQAGVGHMVEHKPDMPGYSGTLNRTARLLRGAEACRLSRVYDGEVACHFAGEA